MAHSLLGLLLGAGIIVVLVFGIRRLTKSDSIKKTHQGTVVSVDDANGSRESPDAVQYEKSDPKFL